jgi:ABC-2 type transport system ATP-binding protein
LVIEVRELSKHYGDVAAVQGISFDARKGEILGFLGPNGAGKTTTMRIITGYLPPTTGTVTVAGFDVVEESMEVRRRIGYLPELPPLYPDMTVESYLRFVAKIKAVPSARIQDRLDETMERTAVTHVRHTVIGHLSKGYRQRVGIAQALVHDPDVLILDEPTAGLDPKQIIEIRELITSLGGDRTVILSTHILPEVSMTCEKVVIISNGRIVGSGTPQSLTAQLGEGLTLRAKIAGPQEEIKQLVSSVSGVVDVQTEGEQAFLVTTAPGSDVRDQLASAVVGAGHGLRELRSQEVSLEDIFLKLTKEEGVGS